MNKRREELKVSENWYLRENMFWNNRFWKVSENCYFVEKHSLKQQILKVGEINTHAWRLAIEKLFGKTLLTCFERRTWRRTFTIIHWIIETLPEPNQYQTTSTHELNWKDCICKPLKNITNKILFHHAKEQIWLFWKATPRWEEQTFGAKVSTENTIVDRLVLPYIRCERHPL